MLLNALPLASSNSSLYYRIYTDTVQYLIYYLQAGVLLSALPLASSNGSLPAQVFVMQPLRMTYADVC